MGNTIPMPSFVLKTVSEGDAAITDPEPIDGATFSYTVTEGTDVVSVAADGTITGLAAGTAKIAVTLSDVSARYYDIDEPAYITVTVPKEEFYVRIANINELNVMGGDVIVIKPAPIDGGYVAASTTTSGTNPLLTYSPVALGISDLSDNIRLPEDIADKLLNLKVYLAYGVDSKVNQKDGYRIINLSDGRYFMRTNNNGIYHTDRNGVDAANNGGGFWYNLSEPQVGVFQIKTGSNYLGFTDSGVLTHMGSGNATNSRFAFYAPYKHGSLLSGDAASGSTTLDPGTTAQIPAISLMVANGDNATTVFGGVPFAYTVVDAEGNPLTADAPISVDVEGLITALKEGSARIKVSVAAPFDKYFSSTDYYYDVTVNPAAPATIGFGTDGTASGSLSIDAISGTATLPTPVVKPSAEGAEVIGTPSFNYEVVDMNGNPFPEGEAPISFDPATGVITAVGNGAARIKVSLSDESADIYNADPIFYDVYVPYTASLDIPEGNNNIEIITGGTVGTVFITPALKKEDGTTVEGVTYAYEIVDENGEPFAEGEAPVTVDPATGKVSVIKPGQALVKVSLAGEDANLYKVEPVTYSVSVTTAAQLIFDGIDIGEITLINTSTSPVKVPTPQIAVTDEEGNFIDAGYEGTPSFTYEVVDMDGLPFAEGRAPITVDENGNVTVVPGAKGPAFVKVSLSGDAAKIYGAEPYMYEVNVVSPTEIVGTTGEESYSMQIGLGETATVPVIKLQETHQDGEMTDVENASFIYEVVNENGESFAEGEAPVTVDESGNITVIKEGTAMIKVTLSDETAATYTADPFYIEVSTKNYTYITFHKISTMEELTAAASAGNGIIMVSSVPLSGKGFVAATSELDNRGNFITTSILPGVTTLPDQIVMTNEQADTLQAFYAKNTANNAFGFMQPNGKYIYRNTQNGQILRTNATKAYNVSLLTSGMEGFNCMMVNNFLCFYVTNSGTVLSHQSGKVKLANPVFYSIDKVDSQIEFTNPDEAKPIILDKDQTVSTPAAELKSTGTNNEPNVIQGANFKYEVVDAEGNAFAEGDAPITVDAATGEITAVKGGEAQVKVSLDNDDAMIYNAGSKFYQVSVPYDAALFVDDNDSASVNINHGESITLEAPVLKIDGTDTPVEGISFTYQLADADGNPLYNEDGSPLTSNDLISVDPATGEITTVAGAHGSARVIAVPAGDKAYLYKAEPFVYTVNVTTPATLSLENDAESVNIANGTEDAFVPTPELKVGDTAVEGATFVYEVVDENGQPFAEGEAPIAVDAEGNITTLQPGRAFVKVSLAAESASQYGAEPVMYEVNVTTPAQLDFPDDSDGNIMIEEKQSGEIPTPKLFVDDEVISEPLTFTYTVVDLHGQPFAEGEAPVTVDENGYFTAVKEGMAIVIVNLSDKDAMKYDVQPINYLVNVSPKSGIDGIEADGTGTDSDIYFDLRGVRVDNPAPGIYVRVRGNKVDKVHIK